MRGGKNIKSASDHKKAGTFRGDRHADRIGDSITPIKHLPDPPEYFDKRHQEVWKRVCKGIVDMGAMAEPDTFQIEIFVTHWFIWKDAMADVQKNGYTVMVEVAAGMRSTTNPALAVMSDSAKICASIADKFGFSAKARMGIKVADASKEKAATILDFIKGGQKGRTG